MQAQISHRILDRSLNTDRGLFAAMARLAQRKLGLGSDMLDFATVQGILRAHKVGHGDLTVMLEGWALLLLDAPVSGSQWTKLRDIALADDNYDYLIGLVQAKKAA